MRNKLEKGFNTTELAPEFCRAYEELSEAYHKLTNHESGVGEELADVTIFLLGMCEILGINLEKELVKKIEKNKLREYRSTIAPDGKKIFIRIKTNKDP